MITILNTDIPKFTHSLHFADLHIRLNKRHDEYREVFDHLYEEIKQTPPDTFVALLGDVFHSKSDLSPECVQMASDLFTGIAALRPLVLVAGNHDATLSNKNRLDSLTPIVEALNNPRVYYLRNTGLYGFGNVLFNNMCVFDQPEKYILGETIPAIYRNQYEHIIALFHGPVDKASLDTGYSISNPAIMNPLFDWNDIAMLGDIHKKQDMQAYSPDEHKPCIHYVGSLIQQNHGEGLRGHGYSLWDLKTRSYAFKEVKNDFGYFTVDIHKGQLTTDLTDLPKKTRLRIKCYESIASETKAVIAKIKEKVAVVEIAYIRMDQEPDKKDVIPLCKDIVLTDLTNVDYQNRLITEFLQKKTQIKSQTKIDDILKINRETNALIKRDEFSRNLKWKPIRFEFDNMFAFGEGNVVSFENMNGVYGIFGPNKLGKSSILSALLFCLYDKFDRGYKGMFVLNAQKSSFRCKLEFEIAGIRYFIERHGTTTRSGNVKVDVKFWKVVNGIEEELHGTARRDTNDIIRDYVGTYEDLLHTAVSFQTAKDYKAFIDMGNSDRKDLLVQFIGLNVFDRLHEAANDRNKELTTILKLHKDKNYPYEIQQNQLLLDQSQVSYAGVEKEVESLRQQIAAVNEQIVVETSNLIRLDENIPTNLPQLEMRKSSAETALRNKRQSLEEYKRILSERETQVSDIDKEIKKIEESNLVESHKTYKVLTDKINELKKQIEFKRIEIKGKLEKVERLKTHQYDPNCKYCVNNSFVKDATKAKEELVEDKRETDKMMSALDNLRTELTKYMWVEKSYETYTKLLTDRSKIKDECSRLSKNIIISTNELEKLDAAFKKVIEQIELYNRNMVSVEANEKVSSKIVSYRSALVSLNSDYNKQHKALLDVSGKMELYKAQIEKLKQTIQETTEMEYEYDSYQCYLTAVGRDGIPYQVICNTVPEIEREVNSILSQVVDYTIQFETDGKNIVPYVVYDYGRWPIELTSGYERFVASIAMRVALTNISNLPKTTALFIDEGFGTLDPENMASMATLFTFLKSNYDFIVVISHLDALKDGVDYTIEITNDSNFSKVIHE